jgi:adenosylmethionine-8-amino-7-oxononanoate aminotransferase
MKKDFEPLAPGGFRVPNTNLYRHPESADDPKAFGRWAADRIEEAILFEGADTVAAVFLEPVQNSGGCLVPPPGYFGRVREICDRHDVLLVSDEVICAFGRHGATFACEKFGYTPDLITCAKGMSSGYGPIGAMIASDRVMEPFLRPGVAFPYGYTFGGHPVAAAVSLANLDVMEHEGLNQRVLDNEAALGATCASCWTCRSSATSAATATSGPSSWSRTRPPGRRSTPRSGSDSSAASCPGRCSTTACTAAPTTAATWSSR